MTTCTVTLFVITVVKVLVFAPAGMPATIHWYSGAVPPLTGVAVKVTVVFVQTVVVGVLMLTAGFDEATVTRMVSFPAQ